MARTWSAVLARVGVPTGDGRILADGGGSGRGLPLPIAWQYESGDGHDGSIVVARMETLRIADGMVTATGTMLEDIPYKVVEELEAGVIGPSVDLDDIEYVMDDQERIVLTRWRVAGATLVAIPAFADVSFTLDPLPAEPMYTPDWVEEPYDVYAASLASFALAAAAPEAEVLPPAEWFGRPDLDGLTPLTVSDTGRVFGHIAGWGTCHVGLPGCVTPPSSPSGYSYFHVGEQRTRDGAVLPVGTLTVGGGHADASLGFRAAAEHYDDVGAGVARVVAGEDEYGIWVAGWMLPGADPAKREQFGACPVSGDWRRVGGALELIAVCSVNTPGFPVPRARVAFSSGAQTALCGTFGQRPVFLDAGDETGPESAAQGRAGAARAQWARAEWKRVA